MRRIIDVAEAKATQYSAEELAEELEVRYGYSQDQMSVGVPLDDLGYPDLDRVRVVVYESDAKTAEKLSLPNNYEVEKLHNGKWAFRKGGDKYRPFQGHYLTENDAVMAARLHSEIME